MKNIFVILFGGKSTRFDTNTLKQFYIINDKPLCYYSLKPIVESKYIDTILVVTDLKYVKNFELYLENKNHYYVSNGDTRFQSVDNALNYIKDNNLADDNDNIFIHDGARPLLDEKIILELIKELENSNAVTTAIKMEDTIALINNNEIMNFPNRNQYVRIQTPQAFKFHTIFDAHKIKNTNASDDAQLILNLKENVKMVEGSKKLYKITTVDDINIMKAYLK